MLKWHLRTSGLFNIMNVNSGFGRLICLYTESFPIGGNRTRKDKGKSIIN